MQQFCLYYGCLSTWILFCRSRCLHVHIIASYFQNIYVQASLQVLADFNELAHVLKDFNRISTGINKHLQILTRFWEILWGFRQVKGKLMIGIWLSNNQSRTCHNVELSYQTINVMWQMSFIKYAKSQLSNCHKTTAYRQLLTLETTSVKHQQSKVNRKLMVDSFPSYISRQINWACYLTLLL